MHQLGAHSCRFRWRGVAQVHIQLSTRAAIIYQPNSNGDGLALHTPRLAFMSRLLAQAHGM